jgi:hypothetical protein
MGNAVIPSYVVMLERDYHVIITFSVGPTFLRSSRNLYCICSVPGNLPLYFLKSNILLIIRCNFIQMNCLLRIALSLKRGLPSFAVNERNHLLLRLP